MSGKLYVGLTPMAKIRLRFLRSNETMESKKRVIEYYIERASLLQELDLSSEEE